MAKQSTDLKWLGNKLTMMPQLLPYFPSRMDTLYDPFCGSMNVYYSVKQIHPHLKAVCNDANSHIIEYHQQVKENVGQLCYELEKLQAIHDKQSEAYRKAFYLESRKNYNTGKNQFSPVQRAALFKYFNRRGFNGLWRENKSQEMNVPFGRYDAIVLCKREKLIEQSILLQDVQFMSTHQYTDVLFDASPSAHDVVYADPPYLQTFGSYTGTTMTEDDQRKLAQWLLQIQTSKITVIASNSLAALPLYESLGFTIHKVSRRGSMNSDTTKRQGVSEIIATFSMY